MYWLTLIFVLFNLWWFPHIPSAVDKLEPFYGQPVTVTGRVEPLSVKRLEQGTSFLLEGRKIRVRGKTLKYEDRLRIFVKDKYSLQGEISVSGELRPLDNFYNPGTFDGVTWQKVNRLGGRISSAEVKVIDPKLNLTEGLQTINLKLREQLEMQVDKRRAALMGGMLLGGSSGLEEADRELFSRQGLAHLLSVSGAHLVLWAGLLEYLLAFLPKIKRRCLVLLLLGLYALLCGARPPVLRAWLMSGLLLWGRNGRKGYLLCLVALLLLAFNPLWIMDMGFQLSFGATAGLLLFLPRCQSLWKQLLPEKLELLAEGLGVTTAAQLLVLPLEIAYFHQFSLVSLISNLLLVPILELVNIITAAGLLIGNITGWFELLKIGDWLLKQLLVQAELLERIPWGVVVVGALPLWTVLPYYGLLGCWADLGWFRLLSNEERHWLMGGLSALILMTYGFLHWLPGPLQVLFLDVGQGDGAIIVTPKGKVVLVDTGGLAAFDTGSRIVAPVLRYLGKSRVDTLFVSHWDYDHIGGVMGLARTIKLDKIVLAKEELGAEGQEQLNRLLLKQPHCRVEVAEAGKEYQIGGTAFKVLDVPLEPVAGNEASTLLEVEDVQNHKKILFTGDMGQEREKRLEGLEYYQVLKVAHHGSGYSSSEGFLAQVKPELAVISVGRNNRYGHPHEAAIERLSRTGARILRTDRQGCLRLIFQEGKIKYNTFRH